VREFLHGPERLRSRERPEIRLQSEPVVVQIIERVLREESRYGWLDPTPQPFVQDSENLASADNLRTVLHREFKSWVKAPCLALGPGKPEQCAPYRTRIETMRVRVLVLSVEEEAGDPEVMDRPVA
jgi:hypothetical protein